MAKFKSVRGGVEVSTDAGVVLGTVARYGESSAHTLARLGYVEHPETGELRNVGVERAMAMALEAPVSEAS